MKPDAIPSQKIPPKKIEPQPIIKKVYSNYKCALCKIKIGSDRTAFGLPSNRNPLIRNKWIKILGGKRKIKGKTRVICCIHFKPSDFKKCKSYVHLLFSTCNICFICISTVSGTTPSLKRNAIPTLFLNGEQPLEEVTISDDEPMDNLNIRRYNFGTAVQARDESLDDFFYRLEILAKHCEYNDMKDDLIRDRFIIGIDDTELRDNLLYEENLTLNNVITIANITIKKEIEFVTVLNELPEIEETMPAIKNEMIPNRNLPKITKNPIKPLKPLNTCYKCNETFRSPNLLFQHILFMHSLKFLCKICKAKFHSSEDLMAHVKMFHKTSEYTETTDETPSHSHGPGDCFSSDDSCPTPKEKQIYPYMCELCAEIIKTPAQSTLHNIKHAGTRPYLCTTCGLGFTSPRGLSCHEMIHTGIKPYTCEICSRSFGRSNHLKTHMLRLHKMEMPKREKPKKEKVKKTQEVTLKDITMDINFDVNFGSFEDVMK